MITVVGGTGRLGRMLLDPLGATGEQVRCAARRPGQGLPSGVEQVIADVRHRDDARRVVEGARVVVAAMSGMNPATSGSPAAVDRDGCCLLIDAAGHTGADVVLVSVVGAAPEHPLQLHQMKWAAEQHLRASPGNWTIVRSALFLETILEVLRGTTARDRRPAIVGSGRNPINVVPVADVAAQVIRVVRQPALHGQVHQVTGAQDLTLEQLAAMAVPGSAPRHLPVPLARALATALAPIRPGTARALREAAAMDRADLTGATSAATEQLIENDSGPQSARTSGKRSS